MRAPITIPLMSPSATVANTAPTKARLARPIPSTPCRRDASTISGMIRCPPALSRKLKLAVSSSVSTASATKRNSTVLSEAEKFVTASSLVKVPVSTMTGRVCPLLPSRESSRTGKTNDPSELTWSLMTP